MGFDDLRVHICVKGKSLNQVSAWKPPEQQMLGGAEVVEAEEAC
jgi:hypothetical protein